MTFVPFAMERWQSTYEQAVEVDLSESGVHPLRLDELFAFAGLEPDHLGSVSLRYNPTLGSVALRQNVAALHPGAGSDNVLVTNGSAEANFVACWSLCSPGDEIVFMNPNYFQIAGVGQNLGASVQWWNLKEADWQPDLEALDRQVNERTRLIVVTHPNNPTGAVFTTEFHDRVTAAAERVGAWVISDEVYRGAEIDGIESPTFWGRYDRVIVTGGLSKAYGLPGLRIGWAVSDPVTIETLWSRRDYTSIAISTTSEELGRIAVSEAVRPRLIERTRGILRRNWPIVEEWLGERRGCFQWHAPKAGAIVMVRYDLPIGSLELVERMRLEQSCLLVPGAHFQLPRYLRLGFGLPVDELRAGLDRVAAVIDPLAKQSPVVEQVV